MHRVDSTENINCLTHGVACGLSVYEAVSKWMLEQYYLPVVKQRGRVFDCSQFTMAGYHCPRQARMKKEIVEAKLLGQALLKLRASLVGFLFR